MCEAFKNELSKGIVDPLILIPCFILDFLCIHPFNDGNGRMSRLLTLLLLYKCGYTVGQYISIEKLLPRPKKAIMTHSLYPIIDGMKPKMTQRNLSNTCSELYSLAIVNLKIV